MTAEDRMLARFSKSPLGRLGVRYPILQAPMAGTATPAMAAAVSNAGGLGGLGVGTLSPDAVRKTIRDTRALTDKPFNLNFFVHEPAVADSTNEDRWRGFLRPLFAEFDAEPPSALREIYRTLKDNDPMIDVLVDEKPAVISFHFGLPSAAALARLKDAGAVLMASATNLEEAKIIKDAGIDLVVAQGAEAGGHRGCFDPLKPDAMLSTAVLTRLIADTLDIPVVAAGGIMSGSDVAGALHNGAIAAQLGTAYILCPESAADEGQRKAMRGEGAYRTILTPLISGRPARCLGNNFTDLAEKLEQGMVQPAYPIAFDAGKALHSAAKKKGEEGYGAHWAGQGAPLARSMPAQELTETLIRELRAALGS